MRTAIHNRHWTVDLLGTGQVPILESILGSGHLNLRLTLFQACSHAIRVLLILIESISNILIRMRLWLHLVLLIGLNHGLFSRGGDDSLRSHLVHLSLWHTQYLRRRHTIRLIIMQHLWQWVVHLTRHLRVIHRIALLVLVYRRYL